MIDDEYDEVCPDGALDDFWGAIWAIKKPSLGEGQHQNKGDSNETLCNPILTTTPNLNKGEKQ